LAKDSRSAAPAPASETATSPIRWAGLFLILLGMGMATARLCSTGPLNSANDRSRWCTVWSLAEKGTYQIDEARKKPGWDTIDLVKHDEHFYSTKPPLLPWCVTQLYRVQKLITGWTLDTHLNTVTRLLLFLINIVPMTIALVLWQRMIEERIADPFAQLFGMALLSGGTMLSPFLAVFNNHTVAATAIMIGIWAVDRIQRGVNAKWEFVLAGAAFGIGICNELPSAALVGLIFLLLWSQVPRAMWSLLIVGALIPLGLFFWTNYQATGGLRPFYSFYGTEKYAFIHEGVPSYWKAPRGIDSNRDSFWVYLLHCTVGHHGWFSLTPVFLLSLVAWIVPKARGEADEKSRWPFLIGSVSVIVFAFYLLKTDNYNYGGQSVALRWMQWLAPAWVLVMLPAVEFLAQWRWGRCVALLLLAVSVASAWCPSDGPWKQSWLFTFMEDRKWIDYSDPKPKLPRPVRSWIYTLPDGISADPDYWIEFTTDSPTQGRETLRISDGGPSGPPGMPQRRIDFLWNAGTSAEYSDSVTVVRGPFLEGAPVEDCIVSNSSSRPARGVIRLLSGVPVPGQYWPSATRYLRTAIQKDAITTLQAYAFAEVKNASGQLQSYMTRDVWFTSDVPFGLVQMEVQIRPTRTSLPQATQRYWVTRVGKRLTKPKPQPPPESDLEPSK
jgi:hypothetical protein